MFFRAWLRDVQWRGRRKIHQSIVDFWRLLLLSGVTRGHSWTSAYKTQRYTRELRSDRSRNHSKLTAFYFALLFRGEGGFCHLPEAVYMDPAAVFLARRLGLLS